MPKPEGETCVRRVAGTVLPLLLAATLLAGCHAARDCGLDKTANPSPSVPLPPGFAGLLPGPSELATLVDEERLTSSPRTT
jgi:hypothetical protein